MLRMKIKPGRLVRGPDGDRAIGRRSGEIAAFDVSAAGVAGRVDPGCLPIAVERLGDVVSLGNAAGRDGSAAGPIAAHHSLASRSATLGHALDVVGRVAQCIVGSLPAILKLDLRVGVPVRLVRATLAPTARSHAATLPLPTGFVERGVALTRSLRRLVHAPLFVAYRAAIDHGPDRWHP